MVGWFEVGPLILYMPGWRRAGGYYYKQPGRKKAPSEDRQNRSLKEKEGACGAAGASAGADAFAVWADGNASVSGSALTHLSRANV